MALGLRSRLLAAGWLLLLAGCPRAPLPPPPAGTGGPAAEALAKRDAAVGSMRANAVIRTRIPEGREGAPGGKITAIAIAAARPPRARLEVLTPLGTPAATLLLADGLLQAYDPFAHRLVRAPLDAPDVLARLGSLPFPLEELPGLLRGVVALERGEIRETRVRPPPRADGSPAPEEIRVECRRQGRLLQEVRVHAEGGYPLETVRFDPVSGLAVARVSFESYGGVQTPAGPIAFPQKILARVYEAEPQEPGKDPHPPVETSSVEIRLSGIEVDPALGPDAFRLVFDRPPEIREL